MKHLFRREQKKLWSTYKKKLKTLQKKSFNSPPVGLDYFVTYLRYLRDFYIIQGCYKADHPEHIKTRTLITAIKAYEESLECIHKYYQVVNSKIVQIAQGTAEEVSAKYAKERAFHWGLFWRLVTLNIED